MRVSGVPRDLDCSRRIALRVVIGWVVGGQGLDWVGVGWGGMCAGLVGWLVVVRKWKSGKVVSRGGTRFGYGRGLVRVSGSECEYERE